MPEMLLPPKRAFWVFMTIFSAGMCVFMAYAYFITNRPTAFVMIMAVLSLALFGFFLYASVRNLVSPGLRLTSEGFEVGGAELAVTLGKVGFYLAPAYLRTMYHTEDHFLWNWLWRTRNDSRNE